MIIRRGFPVAICALRLGRSARRTQAIATEHKQENGHRQAKTRSSRPEQRGGCAAQNEKTEHRPALSKAAGGAPRGDVLYAIPRSRRSFSQIRRKRAASYVLHQENNRPKAF